MSNSSPSPQPLQQEQTLEYDAVHKLSPPPNQETLTKPDPPPKRDPDTATRAEPNPDPVYNSTEKGDEEDEEGEMDEGQDRVSPAISGTPLHIDITLTSPSADPGAPRKRKKGKGNVKKQQAIQDKFQTLMDNLNPIPFLPPRILVFTNHEKLLKKLGLWDFVHIDFDRSIRIDLIAQLVASYNPKQRGSYVNNHRVMVNRADLARAFKLPFKKEGDLDWDDLSDDSIGFLVDFLSEWLLLHEDIWVMPSEVKDWMVMVKEGHPEKVDWAGLLWLMVEKELKQAGRLRDCYYAAHLQHLIKSQHEHLLLEGEEEEGGEVNEENFKILRAIDSPREEGPTQPTGPLLEGPSTELTLGHDGEEEEGEGMRDVEMNDGEKCGESEEESGEEREKWVLNGNNEEGEHFMQPCGVNNAMEFVTFEDGKDEEEEMDGEEREEEEREEEEREEDVEEEGNDFHGFPSFFNESGKRVIEHENQIPHHSIGNNKRLRINEPWENTSLNFETCLDQIQQMTERARMFYAEKEETLIQSNMNEQLLLNEVQKRDSVIEHLHKARMEEIQKKDREIYRLERELHLMGDVLNGYRKALKDVQRAFLEYKERAKLCEEPTYKDAGPGGLMLTGPELERCREEYKMIVECKVKELEGYIGPRFDGFVDKVNFLDKKLMGFEADVKGLFEVYANRKKSQTDEKSAGENVLEVSGSQPSAEDDEEVAEVEESPLNE